MFVKKENVRKKKTFDRKKRLSKMKATKFEKGGLAPVKVVKTGERSHATKINDKLKVDKREGGADLNKEYGI